MKKVFGNSSVVNVRSKASSSSIILTKISQFKGLEFVESTDLIDGYKWHKVKFSTSFGYVRGDVSTVKEVSSDKKTMLSTYMSEEEFVYSDTAKAKKLDNSFSSDKHRSNAKELLVNIYDKLCDFFGYKVTKTSGYRGPKLNSSVGGTSTSDHTQGKALDVDGSGSDNLNYFHYIRKNLKFKQLIAEFPVNGKPSWVHFSYDKNNNKGQILIAVKKNGDTVYLPYKGNEKLLY